MPLPTRMVCSVVSTEQPTPQPSSMPSTGDGLILAVDYNTAAMARAAKHTVPHRPPRHRRCSFTSTVGQCVDTDNAARRRAYKCGSVGPRHDERTLDQIPSPRRGHPHCFARRVSDECSVGALSIAPKLPNRSRIDSCWCDRVADAALTSTCSPFRQCLACVAVGLKLLCC